MPSKNFRFSLYTCATFVTLLPNLLLAATSITALSDIAIYPERTAPASVVSLNQPDISAQLAAQVMAINVRVGDVVAEDALLASLDCNDYKLASAAQQANIDALQVQEKLAEHRYQRSLSLVEKQLISQDDLDARTSEKNALKAQIQSAKANLNIAVTNESRCQVRSPFRALVLQRLASVGQFASPGTPIVSLLDLENIEVSAAVYFEDAEQLVKQQDLGLFFDGNGQSYPLTIRTVVNAFNETSRNREVRLEFVDEVALPGGSGKLRWNDPRPHIASEYLTERNNTLGFFSSVDDVAVFVPVPGAQAGRSAILEDTSPDTLIVTEGHLGLRDGDALKPSPAGTGQ